MPTREEQKEARRQEILMAALDLFIKKGFGGTRITDIAKAVNMSTGLLFHYFDSKEKLYEALIEMGCSKLILAEQEEASPLGVLREHAAQMFQMIRENPLAAKMFVFMGYAGNNVKFISEKAAKLLETHNIVLNSVPLIQRGQKLGEMRSGDALALSIAFWSAVQGIAEVVALEPKNPMPEIEWVVDILKKRLED